MPPRKRKAAGDATVLGRTVDELGDALTAARTAKDYGAFHAWVESSLNVVRPELAEALFPVFAHCYVRLIEEDDPEATPFLEKWAPHHEDRYPREVAALREVKDAKRDAYCRRLRASKFKVALGPAANDLLAEFVWSGEHAAVLKVLNDFVSIETAAPGEGGRARLVDDDDDDGGEV